MKQLTATQILEKHVEKYASYEDLHPKLKEHLLAAMEEYKASPSTQVEGSGELATAQSEYEKLRQARLNYFTGVYEQYLKEYKISGNPNDLKIAAYHEGRRDEILYVPVAKQPVAEEAIEKQARDFAIKTASNVFDKTGKRDAYYDVSFNARIAGFKAGWQAAQQTPQASTEPVESTPIKQEAGDANWRPLIEKVIAFAKENGMCEDCVRQAGGDDD